MKRLLIVALTLIPLTPMAADKAADELAIRDAAFRFQFAGWDPERKAEVYCVGTSKKQKVSDPDDAFLKRFAGNAPPVTKASACKNAGGAVTDKKTGKTGIAFTTSEIKWTSDAEAQLRGGFSGGTDSGASETFFVRKTGGKWVVFLRTIDTIR